MLHAGAESKRERENFFLNEKNEDNYTWNSLDITMSMFYSERQVKSQASQMRLVRGERLSR